MAMREEHEAMRRVSKIIRSRLKMIAKDHKVASDD